jgi:hypothetical protein
MGSRLQLRYGLVAEQDRLSTSADTLLVNEPATGSKSRTKGNLYLIVSSANVGGRSRDATALVAETVRREYYYDESAGIPACLEKTLRSANRKLRSSREGNGLAPASIGVAIAVIRSTELYVATVGDIETYLVRAARLLMPEHASVPGIPAGDAVRVDVWRGEFAIGDSLLLVSRNLTEVVGTEELKNAVVTLHPQSAVEHLHHLFVAAGGEGSDAVLAIEASELPSGRQESRLVPAAGVGDAYGDLPSGSPIPLAGPIAGAASAVGGGARTMMSSVTAAFNSAVDRAFDLLPRRAASARRITPVVSRREAQRRAAIALLGFLGVILALGVLITFWPKASEQQIRQVVQGQQAFDDAVAKVNQVLGAGGSVTVDKALALRLLQEAYADLGSAAKAGTPARDINPVLAQVTAALDGPCCYDVQHAAARALFRLPPGSDPSALARGPDGAEYLIDDTGHTVTRVDGKSGANSPVVISPGDGPGQGIGTPKLLGAGGLDLLVFDARGGLWYWRPSDAKGNGTLGQVRLGGDPPGSDVPAIGTFLLSTSSGEYNLYLVDPSASQILSYRPQGAGNAFSAPIDWLATTAEKVDTFRQLYIDGDVYALTSDNAIKHNGGKVQQFALQTPPDNGDLRPGHDYRLIAGSGDRGTGSLYVYDAKWNRVLVFDKANGSYVAQWQAASSLAPMKDVRGMALVAPSPPSGSTTAPAPILYWLSQTALMQSELTDVEPFSASPAPSLSGGATARPTRTPKPPRAP